MLNNSVAAARLFAVMAALLWAPVTSFAPVKHCRRAPSPAAGFVPRAPTASASLLMKAKGSAHDDNTRQFIVSQKKGSWRNPLRLLESRRPYVLGAAALLLGVVSLPSPCSAANILSHIPSPSDLKVALVGILDGLSSSGTKGMATYTTLFILWTMTIGATTPVETAAGMAFPLQKAIPLSAIGKVSGAFFQYVLAKYLFSDYARNKMKNNKWMDKITASFRSHPYRVALIWRFSPLPEFVKNIGPALVPTLRTKYQILAILTHGLPFTVLWSCIGNEAAIVARGGQASLFLKRVVAVITWVGLVVSPTLFGLWIKGLGDATEESETVS